MRDCRRQKQLIKTRYLYVGEPTQKVQAVSVTFLRKGLERGSPFKFRQGNVFLVFFQISVVYNNLSLRYLLPLSYLGTT